MATDLSEKILRQAQKLSPAEQLELLDRLMRLTAQNGLVQETRSILELEGLGKDLWEGVDPQEFVRRERQSWNG
jgi:hypothetical protein